MKKIPFLFLISTMTAVSFGCTDNPFPEQGVRSYSCEEKNACTQVVPSLDRDKLSLQGGNFHIRLDRAFFDNEWIQGQLIQGDRRLDLKPFLYYSPGLQLNDFLVSIDGPTLTSQGFVSGPAQILLSQFYATKDNKIELVLPPLVLMFVP